MNVLTKLVKRIKWHFSKDKRWIIKPTKEFQRYQEYHKFIQNKVEIGLIQLPYLNPYGSQHFGGLFKWVPDYYGEFKYVIPEPAYDRDFIPCETSLYKVDPIGYTRKFREQLREQFAKYKDN